MRYYTLLSFRYILVGGGIFIFLILLGYFIINGIEQRSSFAKNMTAILELADVKFPSLEFNSEGELFYIYKKDIAQRINLEIYGRLTEDSKRMLENNTLFRCQRNPIGEIISINPLVPKEIIKEMHLVYPKKSQRTLFLPSSPKNPIICLTYFANELYINIKILNDVNAFILILQQPGR